MRMTIQTNSAMRKQTYMKDSNAVFMGVDDNFGMLLRDEDGATSNIPLTTLLEE